MTQQEFILLFHKYLHGESSEAEIRRLTESLEDPAFSALLQELITEQLQAPATGMGYSSKAMEQLLESRLKKTRSALGLLSDHKKVKVLPSWNGWKIWRVAAVLAVCAVVGMGIYRYDWLPPAKQEQPLALNQDIDIAPGHNGAILHLSDGGTLVLDSAQDGTIAYQGKIKVIKENGALKYEGNTDEVLYNTISTSKGRQWKMVLPDGSKVWLNASSSIRYPLSFNNKERVVEITGEAYFEVVHNAGQPFKVKVRSRVIEDLGTEFNVNAYPDEPVIKTTLVKGAIKVNGLLLHPGQQAMDHNGDIKLINTDAEKAVSWKNGYFAFANTSLQEVMRQLARWYDVEIQYKGDIPKRFFGGDISRNSDLSQVLTILEESNIHFKINQKNIIVMP